MKKSHKKIASIVLLFVFIISIFFVVFVNNKKVETSNMTSYANLTSTTETTTEAPTVSTTEATTVKHKVETTTKKQNNNKVETTTKKPATSVTETTTKKNTEITFNGYKPYEVFVDEEGDEVYYNDFGRLCVAEPTTAEPDPDYDASYCHECGSKDCRPSMDSYYCEICGEDVSALECHPASHFYARFED